MAGNKALRKLSHIAEFAALKTITTVLRLLGVDRASALMGYLWRQLGPFNGRHRRAEMHLRLALPELDAAARQRILGDMWENLGRTAAETVLIPQILREPRRISASAELIAAVDAAESDGRGIVFCSMHTGNWELVACGPRQLGQPMAAVYRRLANPYSDQFLKRLRLRIYDGGLMETGGSSALKLRSLAREGLAIAMLSYLPDGTGLTLPFLGRPSKLASLPVALARRLGIPLVIGRCIRLGGVRFRIDGQLLDMPRTDDVEADIATATARLHATFERWIREEPAQWMWSIRKWGKLPEVEG